jgi:hypothetical protein
VLSKFGLVKIKDVVDFFFDEVAIGSSNKVDYSADAWPYVMTLMSCWFYRASLVYKRSGLISEAIHFDFQTNGHVWWFVQPKWFTEHPLFSQQRHSRCTG